MMNEKVCILMEVGAFVYLFTDVSEYQPSTLLNSWARTGNNY